MITTLPWVFVCVHDIEAMVLGILPNSDSLIGNRILLILRGHSKILGGLDRDLVRHSDLSLEWCSNPARQELSGIANPLAN